MVKMTYHIITLFPEAFPSYFGQSILRRAVEDKTITVKIYNPRDFTTDKHRKMDDRPYGGGPGMVMYALPILKVVEKIKKTRPKAKVILFSAQGGQFTNVIARSLAKKYKDIILIAGHYEGIDARVTKILKAEEVSIGPYILTGGELPAMVLVDSISRQIKGVLGKSESLEEDRIASSEVYTRPEILEFKGKKYRVPKVMLSGNHKKIEEYRRENSKS
jgi:tRNA (guanine37-N1)-methyltransferase